MISQILRRRLFASKSSGKADLLQELYLKELKNIKPSKKNPDEVPAGVEGLKSLNMGKKSPSSNSKGKKSSN